MGVDLIEISFIQHKIDLIDQWKLKKFCVIISYYLKYKRLPYRQPFQIIKVYCTGN